ncbi:adenylate kinase [Peribacillus loiseleuriae]|uniref:adenylate kinase n=1 Tax=Peribacillus loiseleuriae TaxID=1679170 RepID=UPI003D068B7A
MNSSEFETKLNWVYVGKVKALNSYVSEHAVLLFHCDKCGAEFYGKPMYMIGKDHQRHICTMPYGDRYGERLFSIHSRPKPNKKKTSKDMGKRFYEMVIEDYTPSQIAKELQVNPKIIMMYFKEEGLIE